MQDALEAYQYHITYVKMKSKRTIDSYMRELKHYIAYMKQFGEGMDTITYGRISDYLDECAVTKKAASINHIITVIRPFSDVYESGSCRSDAVFEKHEVGTQAAALFE